VKTYLLPLFLFLATFVSMTFSSGTTLAEGLLYASTLMGILVAHELGHYLMCRKYRVPATLPLFLPAPATLFGTLGAIIRMDPNVPDRRVLFDIAVAGPLAGAVLAIPALLFGLTVSTVVQVPEKASTFGDSLLIAGLVHLVFGALPPGYDVLLHPVAFAGWVGLFVTSLNLMPISQLDGGHVLYALAPRRAATLYRLALLSLVILCFAVNPGFLLLALLLVLFRLQHPPTRNDLLGLDRTRLVVAALVGVLFVLTFIPNPVQLGASPLQDLLDLLAP